MKINIIGAGLAGVEACWYLHNKGYEINLYEMRPTKMTPAHKTEKYSELVCSNSLKSESDTNACGILKIEMEKLNSLVMKSARLNSVPSGGALAVDREGFSQYITDVINSLDNDDKTKILDEFKNIFEDPKYHDLYNEFIEILKKRERKFLGKLIICQYLLFAR